MIRTILLDLGNVLVHFSHQRMCAQIAALVDAHPAAIQAAVFESGLLPPLERGEIDPLQFQRRLESALHVRFETEALARAAADIFELNTPMRPLLDKLRHQGYRLVLLSNTSITHYDWIRERFDVFAPFNSLILSFQAGAIKPEKKIFDRVLQEIHCAPDECFYTDDIPAYVEAGRRVGLQAEVYTDAANFVQHLRARGVMV